MRGIAGATGQLDAVPSQPFSTGRKQLFEHPHEQLSSEHTATLSRTCALSGLGGIDKTQTAVKYAHHFARVHLSWYAAPQSTS